jgi:hypothetical protein
VDGGDGEDTLLGGLAFAGNVCDGGPAKDQVLGNGGSDTFMARDGKRDSLDGGSGIDKARVDAIDNLARIEQTF